MLRRTITALLTSAAVLLTAGPVAAKPPVGVCAPAFTPATLQDMFDRYPDVLEAAGADALAAVFDIVDLNDNQLICERSRPAHATAWQTQLSQATVVDDTSAAG